MEKDWIPESKGLLTWRLVFCTFIATLSTASVGVDIAYSSTSIPDINAHPNPFHLSFELSSFATSIITLGGIISAILCGYASDRFGRKHVIVLSALPSVLAWLLVVCSRNATTFIVGRFLIGTFSGFLESLPAIYVGEIAPRHLRGRLSSSLSVMRNAGYLYSTALGYFLHWNWLAIASCVCAALVGILAPFICESPRWLLLQKRDEEAKDALLWLRGETQQIEEEVAAIKETLPTSPAYFCSIFKSNFYKPCFTIFVLFTILNFSGIPAFNFYLLTLFSAMGGATINPHIQSISYATAGLLGSVVCGFVIDRFGRKPLLVSTCSIVACCLTLIGLYFMFADSLKNVYGVKYLPLTLMMCLTFCSRIGIATIPHVLIGELFPAKLRGIAAGISLSWLYVTGFIFIECFPLILKVFGYPVTFLALGAVALCGTGFSIFGVRETKGKSLEDVQRMFG